MNENIPCRELTAEQIDSSFETAFLKITLRTQKWLIIGPYRPHNQQEQYFFKNLGVFIFLNITMLSFLKIIDLSTSDDTLWA